MDKSLALMLLMVLVVIVFRMNDQHGVEGITMAINWFDVQRKCKEVRNCPHLTAGILSRLMIFGNIGEYLCI